MKSLYALCLAAAFTLPSVHAATLVSNLGAAGFGTVGNFQATTLENSYWAFQFTTGPVASSLSGATMPLANDYPLGGTPVDALLEASIWADGTSGPGAPVATFDTVPTLAGTTNVVLTDVTFSSSGGIDLAANTPYWIAVRNKAPAGAGTPFSFGWQVSNDINESSGYGWTIANAISGQPGYYYSIDGGTNWFSPGGNSVMKFALQGTPVPEPSLAGLAMVALGVGALGRRRSPQQR